MANGSMSEDALRLFLAVPLRSVFSQEIKEVLTSLKEKIPGVKWVEPEQVHITLHFFGDVPAEQVEKINQTMQGVLPRFPPMNLRLTEVGAFPDLKRPRVIWIGVEEGNGVLIELQKAVQNEVRRLGFEIEARAFKPHATLGRVKKIPQGFSFHDEISKTKSIFPTSGKSLNHFVLFQSRLLPQGSRYEILKTFSLSKAA